MGNMLQFKMGTHAGIKTLDEQKKYSPGTVYVTTDEQAMYVDINEDTRIRLSDIIQVETVGTLKTLGPKYSSRALYYIIDDNALLKYTGDGISNHTWNQINSTQALEEALITIKEDIKQNRDDIASLSQQLNGTGVDNDKGLVGRVEVLEGEMDNAEGRLTSIEGRADTLEETIGDSDDQVDAQGKGSLYAKVNKNTTNITEIKGDVQTLSGNLTDLTTVVQDPNTGLVKKVADLTSATNDLRTDLGQKTDGANAEGSAFARIADLNTKLNTTNNNLNTLEGRIDTAEDDIDQAQTDIINNKDEIDKLKEAIGEGTGLTGRIEALEEWQEEIVPEFETAKSQISDLVKDVEALEAADIQIKKDVAQNTLDIATVTDTANAAKDAIGDESEGIIKDIIDLKAADKTNADNLTALSGTVTGINNTVKQHTTKLNELEGEIDLNTNAIAKLNGADTEEGSVAYQIKIAKEDLQAEIDKDINAANAMTYKGGIDAYSKLPSENVKVGDTWVLTQKSGNYNPGDFFIAAGDEDEATGFISTNLTWNWVKSGYDATLESKLSGANNKIMLTSHTASVEQQGDLGIITFKAATDSSASVSVIENEVVIGMTWGTF